MFNTLGAVLGAVRDASDAEQALCINLGVQRIFVTARAGSGKTEVLAARAASLAERRLVVPPRQILALTFTNRAMENLTSRLHARLGLAYPKYVAVHNFHGFAGRLITAHGAQIGLDVGALEWPDERWRREALAGLSRDLREDVEEALRTAKRDPVADDEVMARLEKMGLTPAIQFESHRQSENRLDYDDVLRHGERLLLDADIAALYRERYPVVFVDEVQDLTPQQLRMITSLSTQAVTAAGDPAQSIFKFAGADPSAAFEALQTHDTALINLGRSYRSAPAVLAVVNALGDLEGAPHVECADPDRFPDAGVVAVMHRPRPEVEAADLVELLSRRVLADPHLSVGVLIRSGYRGRVFEQTCVARRVPLRSWNRPTHHPDVVEVIRKHRSNLNGSDDEEKLDDLRERCLKAVPPTADALLASDIREAIELVRERTQEGVDLETALDECRTSGSLEQPVGPGLHVLNGHVGKGQQFDWVVILGAEAGHIPSFLARTDDELAEERRLFGVMASRAKYGLVVTTVQHTEDQYHRLHLQDPSPWLDAVKAHTTEEW